LKSEVQLTYPIVRSREKITRTSEKHDVLEVGISSAISLEGKKERESEQESLSPRHSI